MTRLLSVTLSVLCLAGTALADTASERYQALHCVSHSVDLEKSIEATLIAQKESVDRRMAMQGFKGESLSKILDVSVQCTNSTTKSFEKNDRVIVSAFYQIRTNLCRFQFSTPSLESGDLSLDFEYIHCVHNP